MIRLKTFLLICLPLLMLGSCAYEQKVLVYEKIPQSPECMRFSDYLEVAACEQEQLKRQNVELQVSLRESSYRLERIHNQGDRCAIQNRVPRPAGCDVSLTPAGGTSTRRKIFSPIPTSSRATIIAERLSRTPRLPRKVSAVLLPALPAERALRLLFRSDACRPCRVSRPR